MVKPDACSKVVTIPQISGTCWFNAILMGLLYSEYSNKMMRRVCKLWKHNTDKHTQRLYAVLQDMIMKTRVKNEKELAEVYALFADITPEHILETMHKLNKKVFDKNPYIIQGNHVLDYLCNFYALMNVKPMILEWPDYDDEFLNNPDIASSINLQDRELAEIYQATDIDVICLVFGSGMDRPHTEKRYVPAKHLTVPAPAKGKSVPNEITFNGDKYILDACLLRSGYDDQCKSAHEIAGISCNKRHYVYNGWMLDSHDKGIVQGSEIGRGKQMPCALMKYDWNIDREDFCISAKGCGLSKVVEKRGLCFNFTKSERVFTYINSKFLKAGYKHVLPTKPLLSKHIDTTTDTWSPKQIACVRQVGNWTHLKSLHKFDSSDFSPKDVKNAMEKFGPKLQKMFDNIKTNCKPNSKHFIFSDVKNGYGAKIIASCFIASGYELAYNSSHKMKPPAQKGTKRFALLSSTTVFKKAMTQATKKGILNAFNARPANTNGENIQFIILDSGFKEGIDLFDVRYVHIFEPQIPSDQKQVIGRATRLCGQQGLKFVPNVGWPLEVFIYDTKFDKIVRDRNFPLADTLGELVATKSGADKRANAFLADLEKHVALAALDYHLKGVPLKRQGVLNPATVSRVSKVSGGAGVVLQYKKMQKEVEKTNGAKWILGPIENKCIQSADTPSKFSFTPTQEFLRKTFTPTFKGNGILAYHSVGSGKTCSAIATASTSFETAGYTIIWVTRTTLKADMWKNMFDQVCNIHLQNIKMPKEMSARKRLLSKAWQIQPLSYKQFTNTLKGKNVFYKKLVAINGKEDPLRKTLLVIDEAHKLFNAADLSAIERPDVPTLIKMLRKSYEVSKGDAVKLLLMTGTPITNTPMDFVRMVNLFKTEKDALPEDFEDFAKEYLDTAGKFTKKGGVDFMNSIAGSVSHLDRSKDARQFAQPIIKHIHSNIIKRASGIETTADLDAKYKLLVENEKRDAELLEAEVKKHVQALANIEIDLKEIKEEIKGATKEEKADLTDQIKYFEKQKSELKLVIKETKANLKTIKGDIKIANAEKRADREILKEDKSQESMIVKCIHEKS